jgi:hypothetical protein
MATTIPTRPPARSWPRQDLRDEDHGNQGSQDA